MQSRTSISHKLILYIFFLGIFVIVAVSLYSFITTRNAIIQRTFDQLTSLRVAKKGQLEQFFNDRIREIRLFSHLEKSEIDITGSNSLSRDNYQHNYLNAYFKEYFKAGKYYNNIFVVSEAKTECYNFDSNAIKSQIINSDIQSELNAVISLSRKANNIVLQDYMLRSSDSTAHLYLASPIFNGSNNDFVVFEFNSNAINNIMKTRAIINGLGESGEVYLVGPDFMIRSDSRFYKYSILKLQVNTESVRMAYNSGEGTHMFNDYRGIMTLSSFSRVEIPGLNWVILSEIDKKEAMRPVYNLANEIVFLSIFITLILFIFAYIISRSISDPIIELKNATISVRKGNLDQELVIKSNDEIGELTENFNLMTRQLKAQHEELKEREVRMFTSFIDGQEDERQRLSRELHDGLGQLIVATKLKTEFMINSGEGINNGNISRLRLMFDTLVDEVRSISNNLMPAVLQEFGLEIALNQVCKEISKHSRIKVIFDSQISEREMDRRIAVYVFRIAQEAINNSVKHANATEIIVTLFGNEKMISLVVQDNGKGINMDEPVNKNGRGINSMSERVKLLNGMFDISKGEHHGTIVSVKIPFV